MIPFLSSLTLQSHPYVHFFCPVSCCFFTSVDLTASTPTCLHFFLFPLAAAPCLLLPLPVPTFCCRCLLFSQAQRTERLFLYQNFGFCNHKIRLRRIQVARYSVCCLTSSSCCRPRAPHTFQDTIEKQSCSRNVLNLVWSISSVLVAFPPACFLLSAPH